MIAHAEWRYGLAEPYPLGGRVTGKCLGSKLVIVLPERLLRLQTELLMWRLSFDRTRRVK